MMKKTLMTILLLTLLVCYTIAAIAAGGENGSTIAPPDAETVLRSDAKSELIPSPSLDSLLGATITVSSHTYTGQPQTVEVTVLMYGEELEAGVDYTVSGQSTATDAGKYTITVIGAKGYTGQKDSTWIINPKPISELDISVDGPFTFDGNEHAANPMVRHNGQELTPGEDYTVSGQPTATNAGTHKVTISAIEGNYTSKCEGIEWRINPKPISELDISVAEPSPYNRNEQAANPKVRHNGQELTPGEDYTVSGQPTATDAGEYTVILTGMGNYSEKATPTWNILPLSLTKATITIDNKAALSTYKGRDLYADLKKALHISIGEIDLTDTEYSMEVKTLLEAGDYTIPVHGIGPNFEASNNVQLTISYATAPSATLVGIEGSNGWYKETPVQITAPSGWTISTGNLASDTWSTFITAEDGEGARSYYLKDDGTGSITNQMSITYKQDTVAPTATVSLADIHLSVSAQDNLSGACVCTYQYQRVLREAGGLHELEVEVEGWVFSQSGPYKLRVFDYAGNETMLDNKYANFYFADDDNDGLNNSYERIHSHTDPQLADTDGDGLTDYSEINRGTNPLQIDTDADGISDGEEVNLYFTDPCDADTNADGLGDFTSIAIRNYFDALSYPGALQIYLNNGLAKSARRMDTDAMAAALKQLEENAYLSALNAEIYDSANRTTLTRNGKAVKLTGGNLRLTHVNQADKQLYGIDVANGLFLQLSVRTNGAMTVQRGWSVKELLGVEAATYSVVADDQATIFVIGAWDAEKNAAMSDLVVIMPSANLAWRIPDSAGSSRFEVSPDASMIVYLMNGSIQVLDLVTQNPGDPYTAPAEIIAFAKDGSIVTSLDQNAATAYRMDPQAFALQRVSLTFSGHYNLTQPLLGGYTVHFVFADGDTELMGAGAELDVTVNGYACAQRNLLNIAYQNATQKRPTTYRNFFK